MLSRLVDYGCVILVNGESFDALLSRQLCSRLHILILETATTFTNETDGVWQLLPKLDLAFISTSNTPSGSVEIHIASRGSNYRSGKLETTTTFANESDGAWRLLPTLDLVFIKTNHTPTGLVEVHISQRARTIRHEP